MLQEAVRLSEIDVVRELLGSKHRPQGWAERRVRLDEVGSVWPAAADIELTPVDLGGVPAEWSTAPGSDPERVLIFFHGGGYCSGSIRSHRRMVTEAGRAARARTLAVEYRLAPEHPFPAALEDALTAWRFLLAEGIPAGRIAVGGDSAGGGLTAVLINHLRGVGQELPACAWLVSPWTDLTMSGASLDRRTPSIRSSTSLTFRSLQTPICHRRWTVATRAFRRCFRTCADFRPRSCRSGRKSACWTMPSVLHRPPVRRRSGLRWMSGRR